MSSTVDDATRPNRRRRLFDRHDPAGGRPVDRRRADPGLRRTAGGADRGDTVAPDRVDHPGAATPTAALDPFPTDLLTLDPDLAPADLWAVDDLRGERIERRRADGVDTVVKRAAGETRHVLQREAAVLEAVDGDEVIRISSYRRLDRHDELHTLDAGRSLLADPWGATPEQRAAAFAEGCAALARLHTRGWFHGAVSLDHLVVDTAGVVRWCSLGSAGRILRPADTDLDRVAVTRAAHRLARSLPRSRSLRRRLRRLGDDAEPRRLARIFRSWSRRSRLPGPVHRARLPRWLRNLSFPTDRLELADRTHRLRNRRRRRSDAARHRTSRLPRAATTLSWATLAVLVAVGVGAAAPDCTGPPPGGIGPPASTTPGTPGDPGRGSASDAGAGPASAAATDATAPTAPTGPADPSAPSAPSAPSGPAVELDGRRGAVGRTGDIALVSDLDCDGTEDLLVLRPSTGEVFDFDLSDPGPSDPGPSDPGPSDPGPSDPGAGRQQGRLVHRDRATVSLEPSPPCGPAIARRSDGTSTAVVTP